MKLTILGCAGHVPGPELGAVRRTSSSTTASGCWSTAGTARPVRCSAHVGLLDLDAVVLSHLHGDHCLDLVAYAYARRYHPDGRRADAPGLRAERHRDRLGGAFDEWSATWLDEVYDFRDAFAEGTFEIGPFDVRAAPRRPSDRVLRDAHHRRRPDAHLQRDSGPCDELVRLASDVRPVPVRGVLPRGQDNPPDIHLTGRQAGADGYRRGVSSAAAHPPRRLGRRERTPRRGEQARPRRPRPRARRAGTVYDMLSASAAATSA